MSKSILNALKAMTALIVITIVCVAVLTVCNMFFPKYVPKLDSQTAAMINTVCPTGRDSGDAFENGYIVMLSESEYGGDGVLASYNKANKSVKAEILAVYGEPKGDNKYAFVIESKSKGRDGDVIILAAFDKDCKLLGAIVKKQGESYFKKLEDAQIVDGNGVIATDKDLSVKTYATFSQNAIIYSLEISQRFASSHGSQIVSSLQKRADNEAVNNG